MNKYKEELKTRMKEQYKKCKNKKIVNYIKYLNKKYKKLKEEKKWKII